MESDTLAAKEFNRFNQNTKQILADMFVDMSVDAGEKLSTIKEAGMTEKITTDQGGVKYKAAVTQNVPYPYDQKMRDYLSVIANHTRVGNITEKSLTTNITKFREFVNDFRARNKISYKLPSSRDAADRGKLVELFEQMVTNSNEYKALENYRKHINEMIGLEKQIDRLGSEIRKISFTEGPKDMEYLKKLKMLRQQAINRLNNYDNILLRLEKSGVLKGLIDRYRKQITQESFDRAKSYYQERNERRENEIRQYYRESRRQAVERHDMAEIRQRIRKDVQRLMAESIKVV